MEATLNLICDCECGPKEEEYTSSAGPGMFPCTSEVQVIPQGWVCDGEDDCQGGEDEAGVSEGNQVPHGQNPYLVILIQ